MGSNVSLSSRIGLAHFLKIYPGMRVLPSSANTIQLQGEFAFKADYQGGPLINDNFELDITVYKQYPDEFPLIKETGGRIPIDPDNHVFKDGELCLGSPFRLHEIALDSPNITTYMDMALVPYLYSFSYWEKTGKRFPFGELDHGGKGLLRDYSQILDLHDIDSLTKALRLLGLKRRVANKFFCPCNCGNRLGVCKYNETIRQLRDRHGRPFFQKLYKQFLQHTI